MPTPKPKRPAKRREPSAAEQLADYLFKTGIGEVADRLALCRPKETRPANQLPGWCKQAVVDAINKFFKRRPTVLRGEHLRKGRGK